MYMSRRLVRWLVLAALLLPVGLLLRPVQAQPGRSGGIGGGIPGGFQGGMPGQPGGFQGGMPGQPGGNIPGGFQGGIPGQPGGNMPGGIGGGMGGGHNPLQDEWVCSGCGAVIGHGAVKPAWGRCPRCGAKFSDEPEGMDFGAPAPAVPAGPNNQRPSASSSRTGLIAAVVGTGLLVLLAAVGAIVYRSASRTARKPAPRRRNRPHPRKETPSRFPPEY
jgi:hypothetical protein